MFDLSLQNSNEPVLSWHGSDDTQSHIDGTTFVVVPASHTNNGIWCINLVLIFNRPFRSTPPPSRLPPFPLPTFRPFSPSLSPSFSIPLLLLSTPFTTAFINYTDCISSNFLRQLQFSRIGRIYKRGLHFLYFNEKTLAFHLWQWHPCMICYLVKFLPFAQRTICGCIFRDIFGEEIWNLCGCNSGLCYMRRRA